MNGLTGRMIGNYRIIDRLGEGGMGTVYRAIDAMVEREVALKCLKPEIAAQPGVLERFRREAVLLARLNHPAVAQLYAFFKEGNEFYMVMEYVAGETLDRVIQRQGALPWPHALAYAAQMMEGLGHAHSLGILHRDLKPANVILTPAGTVKLMDFGIAQALGAARLTREGRIVGTLEYLAPERIQGKAADVRSDLYSAGVVLYEMLTGHLPFESGSDYELLLAQVQRQPPSPASLGINLPAEVEAVVMTALEKDPDRRYADAASFAAALTALIAGAPAAVPEERPALKPTRLAAEPLEERLKTPSSRAGHYWRRLGTSPGRRIGALSAAFAVAAGLTFAVLRPHRAPPEAARPAVAETSGPAGPMAQMQGPEVPTKTPGTLGDLTDTGTKLPSGFAPSMPLTPPPATGTGKTPAKVTPKAVPATPPPAPAPAPATPPVAPAATPMPEIRRAAVAALDQTDGPATGDPGVRPIQLAGLLAALRMAGSGITADVAGPIAARGVSFALTPESEALLRKAGASPELLRLIAASYVAPRTAPVSAAKSPASEKASAAPGQTRTLSDLRSIYVEKADGGLDGYVKDALRRQFGGLMRLAGSPGEADGIMRLSVEAQQKGGAVSGAARVLGIKDRSIVRAVVLDAGTSQVLWQQGAGDRKPIIGAFRGESLKSMAERIVQELKEDLAKPSK